MPSVAMKGLIFNPVMRNAFKSPTISPAPTAAKKASSGTTPAFPNAAATTAQSAKPEATERSNPRVRMT